MWADARAYTTFIFDIFTLNKLFIFCFEVQSYFLNYYFEATKTFCSVANQFGENFLILALKIKREATDWQLKSHLNSEYWWQINLIWRVKSAGYGMR